MKHLPLAALLALSQPAHADTTQQVYTALVITYDGELRGLNGSLVFTEYGACVAYMNALMDDLKHHAAVMGKCTRFVVTGGEVALHEREPE
jgi:hypothetical protein